MAAMAKAGEGRRGKRGQAAGPECCFVCSAPKSGEKKFCDFHNRAHQNMVSQCKTEAEKKALAAAMSDARTAKLELTEFMDNNADVSKFGKKKKIDMDKFVKTYGRREARGDESNDVAMTSWEFERWSQDKKGMTPSGTESWWKELLSDDSVRRDYLGRYPDGRPGALQLYVPNSSMSAFKRGERYVETGAEHSSDPLRNAEASDQRALRQLSLTHSQGTADFFAMSGSSSWQPDDASGSLVTPRAKRTKGMQIVKEESGTPSEKGAYLSVSTPVRVANRDLRV